MDRLKGPQSPQSFSESVFRDESNAPGFSFLSYREVLTLPDKIGSGGSTFGHFWCASQSEAIFLKSRPLIGSRTVKWPKVDPPDHYVVMSDRLARS